MERSLKLTFLRIQIYQQVSKIQRDIDDYRQRWIYDLFQGGGRICTGFTMVLQGVWRGVCSRESPDSVPAVSGLCPASIPVASRQNPETIGDSGQLTPFYFSN